MSTDVSSVPHSDKKSLKFENCFSVIYKKKFNENLFISENLYDNIKKLKRIYFILMNNVIDNSYLLFSLLLLIPFFPLLKFEAKSKLYLVIVHYVKYT